MKEIVFPSSAKRAAVALFDLIIAIFIGLGIYAISQSIFLSTEYATTITSNIKSYQLDSGLYFEENGEAQAYTNFASYTEYEKICSYYYVTYSSGKCPEEYRQERDVYWYNVNIVGLDDVKNLYPNAEIQYPGLELGKTLFKYAEKDGTPNYDVLPSPADSLYGEDGKLTSESSEKLLNFYYSSSSQNVYYNAGRDLYYSKYYQADLQSYYKIQSIYPLSIAIFLSAMIFYFIIPLVFSDGETLGKKIFKLAVISSTEYKAKRGQIILRQLPQILLLTALFFFVSFVYACIVALGLLLASYLFSLFTKKKQSLHDLWSSTMVIDATKSVYFNNANEEENAKIAYEKQMEQARKSRESAQEQIDKENKMKTLQ